MEQDTVTVSDKSSPNSLDHPTSSETESNPSDVSPAPSSEHLDSSSTNEEPESDYEELPVNDCTSTSKSSDETPSLPLLPQSQQSSQLHSESIKLLSSPPDTSKSNFDLPTTVGGGLLSLPPQTPISKRPPLLPFASMQLPIRLQPLPP